MSAEDRVPRRRSWLRAAYAAIAVRAFATIAARAFAALAIALLAFASAPSASAAESQLPALVQCLRANLPASARVQELSIVAYDRAGGSRSLRAELHARRDSGNTRLRLRALAPADVAGTSYLLREGPRVREALLYVPSVGKVRRLIGDGAGTDLFGSGLGAAELKQLLSWPTGGAMMLGSDETRDGRRLRTLHVTAPPGATGEYDRTKLQVDAQTCAVVFAELYAKGQARKRLTATLSSLRQSGSFWYAVQWRLDDLREGTHAELRVARITTGGSLPARVFDPATFHLP